MIVSFFESTYKAYVNKDTQMSMSWEELVALLSEHTVLNKKEESMMFNLWEFNLNGKPGRFCGEEISGTASRCKENALQCHGIVLDYDGGTTINEVKEKFNGLEYLLYTSYRHLYDGKTEKFRVVLPFDKPATFTEMLEREQSIANTFTGADTASYTPSQAFYMYSSPNKKHNYCYHSKGGMISVDMFTPVKIKPVVYATPSDNTQPNTLYKKLMIESLSTCAGLHYASEKSKHGIIMLVMLLKSVGATYAEFVNVVNKISDASSASLKDDKKLLTVWESTPTPVGITKEKRDKFISDYSGVSKFRDNSFNAELNKVRAKNAYKTLNKFKHLFEKYNISVGA